MQESTLTVQEPLNQVTTAQPLVSIVSVNWNQPKLTRLMVRSLQHLSYPNWEVIVVDNGSTKGDIRGLKIKYPDIQLVISKENLGFAGGNNLAFPHCKGKYILLLNNDTEVDPNFLEPLVALMEKNPDVGIVSPKIFFYDHPDVLQYAGTTPIHPITSRGKKFGHGEKDEGQHDSICETGYANGACMLIRAELLNTVGHLYEDYFLYYEEHDFTERVRQAGYRIMFHPGGRIFHKVSASTGKMSPLKAFYLHRNRMVFIRRNHTGITRLLASLYYLLVATPKLWLTAFLKFDNDRKKAIERAVIQALTGRMDRY